MLNLIMHLEYACRNYDCITRLKKRAKLCMNKRVQNYVWTKELKTVWTRKFKTMYEQKSSKLCMNKKVQNYVWTNKGIDTDPNN